MQKLLLAVIVGLSAFGCGESLPVGSNKLESFDGSKASATVDGLDRAENVSQTNSKTEMQKMIQSTEINHDVLATQDEVTSFKNIDNQTDNGDDDADDDDEDDNDDGDEEDADDEDDDEYEDTGKHRRSKMSDDDDPASYDSTYDDVDK